MWAYWKVNTAAIAFILLLHMLFFFLTFCEKQFVSWLIINYSKLGRIYVFLAIIYFLEILDDFFFFQVRQEFHCTFQFMNQAVIYVPNQESI